MVENDTDNECRRFAATLLSTLRDLVSHLPSLSLLSKLVFGPEENENNTLNWKKPFIQEL